MVVFLKLLDLYHLNFLPFYWISYSVPYMVTIWNLNVFLFNLLTNVRRLRKIISIQICINHVHILSIFKGYQICYVIFDILIPSQLFSLYCASHYFAAMGGALSMETDMGQSVYESFGKDHIYYHSFIVIFQIPLYWINKFEIIIQMVM